MPFPFIASYKVSGFFPLVIIVSIPFVVAGFAAYKLVSISFVCIIVGKDVFMTATPFSREESARQKR